MRRGTFVAGWLLAALLLVCSCAVPVLCSRPLDGDDGDGVARRWALGAATGRGGFRPIHNRRSLGRRTTSPMPNKRKASAMPNPPPPLI
ncbi:hypothetical protein BS78_10G063500 [Paspalum vaginatum]|nr:hypothetical protein BS78_10G063500 [Paspalum vaginatum]